MITHHISVSISSTVFHHHHHHHHHLVHVLDHETVVLQLPMLE
jgi:hypothetical protein